MNQDELAVQLVTDPDRYFKQMVLEYQHRLYNFLLRQTGSADEAEDIVQEAFMRAYYALKNYAAQHVQLHRLQPWLYKIALNVFYNHKRTVRFHTLSLDAPEQTAAFEVEDHAPGPEEMAWQHEQLHLVEEAVLALPERYRVVINLYYFEELSYQEIADLLNQPLGTVKAKVSRGLGMLRASFQDRQRDQVG